ncbi:immunoglobulin-like domain-containing protein [Helcococcus kunzii]|uniref:Bacterial Ig-like domain-containing protein n=1 Tax=Helcococcus kunzii ATCC 51366 TaxID=883114 RepID=H3NLJ1_9FIRM|nr:immunoglobulin-like domain-containing protein [Helcococcus kunzii]EHR35843.1 hypothetical protein HMPREF9709_00202 [Helcococcus kunzii ATCC 51366]MCT1796341.1 hypothetical protein [Helcococcus kunzii]MCT1989011.1 hypothetical protein [Helcococcus kunzii]QUY64135.1 hypothetical protein GUI37_00845 [Helcococcus kunzii]QZO76590.1 hypothetical protein HIF96_00780 [Helcococcus kunzii]
MKKKFFIYLIILTLFLNACSKRELKYTFQKDIENQNISIEAEIQSNKNIMAIYTNNFDETLNTGLEVKYYYLEGKEWKEISTGYETWNSIMMEIQSGESYKEEISFEKHLNDEDLKPGKYRISKTFTLENSKKIVIKSIYFTIE